MKTYFIILSIVFSFAACKSKKETSSSAETTTKEAATPTINGKVSHQYKPTGCSSVVIISSADGEITLIPKDPLPKELDYNNSEISFNYITLRMPQPEGCTVGQPAELTNVAKKKK